MKENPKIASSNSGDDDKAVDARELARWLNLSPTSIAEWARKGVIVCASRGRYFLRQSIAAYMTALRAAAAGRASSVAQERAGLLRVQRLKAEIELRRIEGELVSRAAVTAAWVVLCTQVRNETLAAPAKVNARLPHLTRHDLSEFDLVLREILTDLAQPVVGSV